MDADLSCCFGKCWIFGWIISPTRKIRKIQGRQLTSFLGKEWKCAAANR